MERWQCRNDAERDYFDRGVTLFQVVNAMAMAAERKGNGFAYLWPAEVELGLCTNEWDEIARLF
jgi:hypothetical protein